MLRPHRFGYRHEARYLVRRLRHATATEAHLCHRRFGKFCAQLTLFARHLPVLECRLTAHPRPVPGQGRGELRLRVVVCTSSDPSATSIEKEFCEQARRNCGGFGTEVLPHASQAKGCRVKNKSQSRNALVPRRRPTHGSTRQDAECRARRPSRLVQRETDGVTPLAGRSFRKTSLVAASGAPPVRPRVDASCG